MEKEPVDTYIERVVKSCQRKDTWGLLSEYDKVVNITYRMNNMYQASNPRWRDIRSRYASEEQNKEETKTYKMLDKALSVVFLQIKEDYLSIRDFALKHKNNPSFRNVDREYLGILEEIVNKEAENILLGEDNVNT